LYNSLFASFCYLFKNLGIKLAKLKNSKFKTQNSKKHKEVLKYFPRIKPIFALTWNFPKIVQQQIQYFQYLQNKL
jgi:hypothetical protein